MRFMRSWWLMGRAMARGRKYTLNATAETAKATTSQEPHGRRFHSLQSQ
jgi:hypothetical protein